MASSLGCCVPSSPVWHTSTHALRTHSWQQPWQNCRCEAINVPAFDDVPLDWLWGAGGRVSLLCVPAAVAGCKMVASIVQEGCILHCTWGRGQEQESRGRLGAAIAKFASAQSKKFIMDAGLVGFITRPTIDVFSPQCMFLIGKWLQQKLCTARAEPAGFVTRSSASRAAAFFCAHGR